MKLIGFCGKMGSGKSTAIQCLREIVFYQHEVKLVKFAEPLYDIQEYAYDRVAQVYKVPADFTKDRKLLQFLGTEWGRSLDKNLWVNIWQAEVTRISQRHPNIIIVSDDVRYDNEAETIKSLGGVIVQIDSDVRDERIDITSGISGHVSESGVKSEYVDYILENNGTIDELKSSILALNAKLALW